MLSTGKLSICVRLSSREDRFGYRRVLIQVLYRRRRSVYFTPYRVLESDFDKRSGFLSSRGRRGADRSYIRRVNDHLRELCSRMESIGFSLQQSGVSFCSSDVISRYRHESDRSLFGVYMRELISDLSRRGQHGTASTYQTTLRRLERYSGSRCVRFENLSVSFLQGFESHLYSCGLQRNTVTFYMRVLRAVYNKAVLSGLAPGGDSPFRSLSFREEKTSKLAVDKSLLRKMARSDLGRDNELSEARDLFMFSFYSRGMSFVDMAYLRYDHLEGDTLRYRRHKSGQLLRIRILPELRVLIERYRDGDSPWVLPILRAPRGEHPLSAGEAYGALLHRRYKSALNRYLSLLDRISSQLGSHRRLTFNVARHSWASLARGEGIPVSVISEGLGHTSEKTTRIYLDELDSSLVDRANEAVSRL